MTLLSSQLLRLRQETSNVLDVDRRKRVSILFTPEEAAKVSFDVVLQLARSGIETLREMGSPVIEFEQVLFSDQTAELERSLLSPEENAQLSENIVKFWATLCLGAAQKCLEWLLCRFYVGEMQTQDLILSLLCYHDTQIFTKLAAQLTLPPFWRFLKNYRREAIHRSIIVKELRSNPSVLARLMSLFESALVDEKSPIVGFVIAVANILISNGAKDSITRVLVQSAIKGLKSESHSFRAFAAAVLSNLSIKHASDTTLLDDALVRKLLKSGLCESAPLNSEVFECLANIYFAAAADLDLPDKFTSTAIDLIGQGVIEIEPTKFNARLINAVLDASVSRAVSSDECDPFVQSALRCCETILNLRMVAVDLTNSFEFAIMAAHERPVAAQILKQMRKQNSAAITPKLSERLTAIDAHKLPAEITIHHGQKSIRMAAVEAIDGKDNQELIQTLLDRETEIEVIRKALEKLDATAKNANLACQIATKYPHEEIVLQMLIRIAQDPKIERFKRLQILSQLLASGSAKSLKSMMATLEVESVTELPEADLDEVLRIVSQTDGLQSAIVWIARAVAKTEESPFFAKNCAKLLDLESVAAISELIGCRLPLALTDRLAFFALRDMSLMRAFITKHLPKNVKLEVSNKVTVGRYFARLSFRHPWCLEPVLTLVSTINCVDQSCSVIELLSLIGMRSESATARATAVSIFEQVCSVSEAPDDISQRILKKSREILADGAQLDQILARVLKKKGVENWKLIHGELSLSGLTKLLELCPSIAADHVTASFLTIASSDSDEAFFLAIFRLLSFCEKDLTKTTLSKIHILLTSNALGAKSTSALIGAMVGKTTAKSNTALLEKVQKELIVVGMKAAAAGPDVSKATQHFLEESEVSVLRRLLCISKKERRRSVIESKRQKMNEEPVDLAYICFILDRLAVRGFQGLDFEINELLEFSLGSEGELEDRVQKSIVGIAAKTASSVIKPEVLVELLRRCSARGENSTNQLLISALSILSSLASREPAKVLKSLMSVFTFMGAGLLARADDRYSFHSIQETIKCVVPPLLKSRQHTNPLQEILDVFCSAVPHVPVHRQVAVFESLIHTCGAEEALWRTWLQLATKHVTSLKEEDDSLQDPSPFSDLMTSVNSRFPAQDVIKATAKVMDFMVGLPFEVEDDFLSAELRGKIDSHSMRNLHYFIGLFVNKLYSSHDFLHGQLARVTDEEDAQVVQLYRTLLQSCFSYTELIQAKLNEDESDKFFKAVNSKATSLIEKIIGLLPPTEFAQCMTSLLESSLTADGSDWLTTQSLEILCTRLRRQEELDSDYLMAKRVMTKLDAVLTADKSVQATNLAARAIKLLAKTTAAANPAPFRAVLGTLEAVLRDSPHCSNIRAKDSAFGAVILCAAVLISELKMNALGSLNWSISAIISGLTSCANCSDSISLILVASLGKILGVMSGFISPHIAPLLIALSAFNLEETSAELQSRLMVCVNSLAALPSRVILPQIAGVFADLEPSSVVMLLLVTEQHIETLERGVAVKQQQILQELFLKALQFRSRVESTVSRHVIAKVESATCRALVRLALKLPEASLRPLLFKIFSWATEGVQVARLLSLYNLYAHLAEALKSMFPIFTGTLSAHLIEILPTVHGESSVIESSEDKRDMLVGILKVLRQIFLYDNGEFLDETTINELIPLLINMFEYTDLNEFDEFCEEYLIPTIAQSAAAISDDSIWRPINYRVLLKTRHEAPVVRIAALKCIDATVDKLGEDYQCLLQESAPQFLAELLEDDDERVEQKMTETVTKLEAIFGESLQNYF